MISEIYAKVSQVQNIYSRAMDLQRWPDMEDVFLPEAEIILGDQMFAGREKGVAAIKAFIECCSVTHHMNSNLIITHLDETCVKSVINFRAWHRGKGAMSSEIVECLGTYEDEFKLVDEGWRIARRKEESPIVIGDIESFFAPASSAIAEILS